MKRFLAPLLLLFPLFAGAEEPRKILRYARGGDAVLLDPAAISDGESAKVTEQVFDTLVRFKDGGFDLEPGLAESWAPSDGGLTWTFRLREGIRFHDGTPFDAAAAKASLQRLRDPKLPYGTSFTVIRAMEAPDARTFVVRLERPYAPFLRNLAMFCAGITPPSAAKDPDAFARAPVGTGPFHLASWLPNEKITLEANAGYWGGRPASDAVLFLPVPDNAKRLKLLETGGADIADGISLHEVAGVEANPSLRLHAVSPGANLAYLAFNTARKPLDDARVRRALAMAIDREGIVKHLFSGRGEVAESVIPRGFLGHAPTPFTARNAAEAKKLLAEAGFPDGFEATLHAMPNPRPYLPEPKRVAQVVQANLAEIGVKVRIVSPDWGAYLEETKGGKHDLCFLGWTTDNGDPDNFAYVLLDPDNAVPGSASNVSFWKDAGVHDLLLRAQAPTEDAERAALYAKVMARVREECPLLPLATTDALAVTRRGVEGFSLHPVGTPRLHRARVR